MSLMFRLRSPKSHNHSLAVIVLFSLDSPVVCEQSFCGIQGLTFIRPLLHVSALAGIRAETWSWSTPGQGPISVYWLDTMGQRGKHYQHHKKKLCDRKKLTLGEGT